MQIIFVLLIVSYLDYYIEIKFIIIVIMWYVLCWNFGWDNFIVIGMFIYIYYFYYNFIHLFNINNRGIYIISVTYDVQIEFFLNIFNVYGCFFLGLDCSTKWQAWLYTCNHTSPCLCIPIIINLCVWAW